MTTPEKIESPMEQFDREMREMNTARRSHVTNLPRVGATSRDEPVVSPPSNELTDEALILMEQRSLLGPMLFTQQIMDMAADNRRLVAALRARRRTAACSPATVAEMERIARDVLLECAPLNLQGRIDAVKDALVQAWARGAGSDG